MSEQQEITQPVTSDAILKRYCIGWSPYSVYKIEKVRKDGTKKVRTIHAPTGVLKTIQRQILKSVLYHLAAHPCAHAYIHYKNIKSGAIEHSKYKYTVTIDIKDFFPSITTTKVRETLEFFLKKVYAEDEEPDSYEMCWSDSSKNVADELGVSGLDQIVALTTYQGSLPQGAPTSGALSNLVFYPLDCLFEQVCVEKELAYSRYADDLTFSGNSKDVLHKFVFGYVFKKLQENGFAVNKRKVHVYKDEEHRRVTGLNVKELGVRPNRGFRRKVRANLANARNKITACESLDELGQTLKNLKYLRRELANFWYCEYMDTYSGNPKQLEEKYLQPIFETMKKHIPNFGVKYLVRNLFGVSPIEKDWKQKVGPTKAKAFFQLNNAFVKIFDGKISSLAQAPTRLAAKKLRQNGYRAIWFYNDKRRAFDYCFSVLEIHERVELLSNTIKSTKYSSILRRACSFIGTLCYKDRLRLVREISQELKEKASYIYGLRLTDIRKAMRGFNAMDLSEFLTSEVEIIRKTAQDMIEFRKSKQK